MVVNNYGHIEVLDGAIATNIESGPNAAMLTVLSTEESFSSIITQLSDFGNMVNGAQIVYLPLTSISNSFAHQAVARLGILRPIAPVNAPGSTNYLKVN